MEILIVGNATNLEEFKSKFQGTHHYHFYEDYSFDEALLSRADVVFDFFIGDDPEQFARYATLTDLPLFVCAPKISLDELAYYQEGISCKLFGFNGLPTFLKRDLLEVSLYQKRDKDALDQVCKGLETDYLIVDDRVGMVTPRVVFMIINEAFYTLQEGTASVEDIDKGMKLGTNYPMGPFEWCDKVGIAHVYEVLEAIYEDTKDERYKICPLLKKKYLAL